MFIVKTASAKMPSSCKGNYRRVAVVELLPGANNVSMISDRAVGCARIVRTWERCNVGKTARSAFAVALAEANALCAQLNAAA